MIQKLQTWIFGSLQVKVILLIVSIMFLLLSVFVYYTVQIERNSLEDVLQQKGTAMAQTGAAVASQFLENAVANGRFTEAEIFDTNYQPIPGTNPQKYSTTYDSFTDANLLDIQDSYLEDDDVLFAVAVDKNGYVPTHNSRYSAPLTGDYEADLEGNRTKRIFDDEIGLAAAQNTDSSLFQVYVRDTGEVAWDISSPIRVNGQHWGAFRVALSLDAIQAQTAALIQRIIVAAGLLAMAISLAAFAIAHQFVRPIVTLANAAQKIGQGDLDVRVKVQSQDEIGQLSYTFNQMADQLKEFINTLEHRVANRTQRLETVAVLSERLTAILDFDELLLELVTQVEENFHYYHTKVYIIDDNRKSLLMTAGSGEVGQKMKAKGHKIPLNAPVSLVARAARNKEIVSIPNVREVSDWLPNELLPDTYSEISVPIVLDDTVLGVLDVQEDKIGGLDESDVNLLRSLANQVAVVIRNAQLFAQVEQSLAEAHRLQERYIEDAWQKTEFESELSEYLYVQPDAPSLPEPVLSKTEQISQTQLRPAIIAVEGNGSTDDSTASEAIVAPVTLSGKPIGALQLYQVGDAAQRKAWTEQDLQLIEIILDQVAQTAENLRLFDDTRERAGREQVVRQVTDKLRAAPTLDSLLDIAARELGSHLDIPYTVLELGIDKNSTPPTAIEADVADVR